MDRAPRRLSSRPHRPQGVRGRRVVKRAIVVAAVEMQGRRIGRIRLRRVPDVAGTSLLTPLRHASSVPVLLPPRECRLEGVPFLQQAHARRVFNTHRSSHATPYDPSRRIRAHGGCDRAHRRRHRNGGLDASDGEAGDASDAACDSGPVQHFDACADALRCWNGMSPAVFGCSMECPPTPRDGKAFIED
jgi:hypothetical protein